MYQEIYEAMCGQIAKQLHCTPDKLTEDTRFLEDLGAKSYDYLHLAVFLEAEYDVDLPYMKFSKNKTLKEMAEYVAKEVG